STRATGCTWKTSTSATAPRAPAGSPGTSRLSRRCTSRQARAGATGGCASITRSTTACTGTTAHTWLRSEARLSTRSCTSGSRSSSWVPQRLRPPPALAGGWPSPARRSRQRSMPAVSVIIPAYNAEAFLARAIRSVEAQSFRDFEIVVIDDGSTDGTADVAQGFSSVRYVLGSHGGEAAARNRGLEEARSELVAFVDADDEWLPEKLARQVAFMDKLGSSFSYTDSYLAPPRRRVRYSFLARPRRGEILEPLIDDWLDQAFLIPTEVMASRALLRSVGGVGARLPTPGHRA